MTTSPVLAVRHFMFRLRTFISVILRNAHFHFLGGPIIDYFVRIEFQMRGSPHAHILLWVANPPSFSTPEGIAFLDKCVTCHLPQDSTRNLVLSLQKHRHSHTCYKKEKNQCRFQFPRPISAVSRLLSDEESRTQKRKVILARDPGEEMINNYKPILLKLWNANLDLSPVGSISELARYICDYMMKPEPEALEKQINSIILDARENGFQGKYQSLQKISKLLQGTVYTIFPISLDIVYSFTS